MRFSYLEFSFAFSSLIYLKLLLVWALVIVADFLLGVRFEYLWTFWLLLRSIYDSFRYQGVVSCLDFLIPNLGDAEDFLSQAYSVFFVCVTVTSDIICFVFIPVQWLFFLASTYVWVQYVWHAGKLLSFPDFLDRFRGKQFFFQIEGSACQPCRCGCFLFTWKLRSD